MKKPKLANWKKNETFQVSLFIRTESGRVIEAGVDSADQKTKTAALSLLTTIADQE